MNFVYTGCAALGYFGSLTSWIVESTNTSHAVYEFSLSLLYFLRLDINFCKPVVPLLRIVITVP